MRREATMYRDPYLLMSPAEAFALNVREGGRVRVITRQGAAVIRLRVDAGIPPKTAVLPTEHPGIIRTLAEGAETGKLPTAPFAGAIEAAETR